MGHQRGSSLVYRPATVTARHSRFDARHIPVVESEVFEAHHVGERTRGFLLCPQ